MQGPKAVTIAPVDTDGDPSTTGPDERAVITRVWQRVAEDFAATDVDVTTQEPGASCDKPLTRWSRGEYADANNPEDDCAAMATHGALPVKDDVPDSRGRAAASTGSSTAGTISSSRDLGVFRVDHAGGTLTVTASPAAVSPDLDLRLTLTTARGVAVATDAPPSWAVDADVATGLDASLSVPLAAGTSYVRVQGSGQDDPSGRGYTGYGSVGRYTLTSP